MLSVLTRGDAGMSVRLSSRLQVEQNVSFPLEDVKRLVTYPAMPLADWNSASGI